ncbi:MAG: hypothetical protein ABIQ95_07865 [Bdellovibrionia bacterium]
MPFRLRLTAIIAEFYRKVQKSGQLWLVFLSAFSFYLSSCSPVGTRFSPAATATTPTTAATSCSTSVIDYGSKGTVLTTQRGLWSDLKIPPNNIFPAFAFYDGSATGGSLTLKFTYWDGNKYVIENVAGDSAVAAGSATWVKLAFLSTGVPMIFWTTGGTNVKMAMRSAAITNSAGVWTSAVIDTVAGSLSRALEVSVSPLDQVGLVYLTGTAVTGRARFIYCDQNCQSPSSFVAMTTIADTIEASNIVATQMQTGMAWCKNSESSYYPAVVYGGNAGASVRYAVCRNPLASCTVAAGWSLQTIAASANIANSLNIDSTVTGDNPKILTKNAGNLQAFQVDQACNLAPASVTAGNTFGTGATSGNAWLSLLKDSTGKFHVVANESTTSVRYHNSVTTNFSTTTWNTAGIVNTLTLAAAGAGGGGAAISSSTGNLYVSYGAGAAPFNLAAGVVNDYTIASNSASAVYSNFFPDQTGHIQQTTSQTRNVSVAATAGGVPAVAYVDFSIGSTVGAKLKYSLRSGTSASSTWPVYIIPGTGNPQYPSLAMDAHNKPWISYYDASIFRFYLVTNSSSDGSGTWIQYQFPLTAMTGNPTLPATNDTALAMQYSTPSTSYPVMFVINSSAGGTNGVKSSRLNPTTGMWSTVQTIDGLGASFASNLSVDFQTSTSSIAVSYLDLTTTRVEYNYTVDPTAVYGTSAVISGAAQGQGLAVKINPSTLAPAISYFDYSNNKIFYASCSGTLVTCQSTGGWTPMSIESGAGVSGLATGATGVLQLLQTSLTINSSGMATVLYPTGIGASGEIIMNTNSSGAFAKTALASGTNPNITGASAMNFALTGFNLSAVRTSRDSLVAVYVGPGNWLYTTSCGD